MFSSLTFTLADVIQLAVFIVTLSGGWFTLRVRMSKIENERDNLEAYKALVHEQGKKIVQLETYHEVHKDAFGKIERTLERIERKLDSKADKEV